MWNNSGVHINSTFDNNIRGAAMIAEDIRDKLGETFQDAGYLSEDRNISNTEFQTVYVYRFPPGSPVSSRVRMMTEVY